MNDEALPYESILESGILGLTVNAVTDGTPDDLHTLVQEAITLAENLLTSLRSLNPPERPAACREGCAHCCRFQVTVTPPEALALADHIRQHQTEAAVATLAATCRALADAERGLDAAGRVRLKRACVFLENECCTVYALRPLACRGANATDDTQCARALDGEDINLSLYLHQANVMKAAARGLNHADDKGAGQLELTAAMAIALNDETAAAQWLAGAPVFAEARLPAQNNPGRQA
ncbi:MAG: YkgJ family cysteine cluster protein [Alphaproteobacteria bacterium]|jgi:Fe-S-cluster containining protein